MWYDNHYWLLPNTLELETVLNSRTRTMTPRRVQLHELDSTDDITSDNSEEEDISTLASQSNGPKEGVSGAW